MLDTTKDVKENKLLSIYAVFTAIVVSSIKNLARYKDVPDEVVVRKTYSALKSRAGGTQPSID